MAHQEHSVWGGCALNEVPIIRSRILGKRRSDKKALTEDLLNQYNAPRRYLLYSLCAQF